MRRVSKSKFPDEDDQAIRSESPGGGARGAVVEMVLGEATKKDDAPHSSGAPSDSSIAAAINAKQQKLQRLDPDLVTVSEPFDILSVVHEVQEISRTTEDDPPPPPSAPGNNGAAINTTVSNWFRQFNGNVQGLPAHAGDPPRPPQWPLQPGAYTALPGITTMGRVHNLDLSLVGSHARIVEEPMLISHSDIENREVLDAITTTGELTNASYHTDHNGIGLMEAMPVESEQFGSRIMEAEPIDQLLFNQKKAAEEAKYKRWNRLGFGFVVLACLVLAVSLAIRLTGEKQQWESGVVPIGSSSIPTASPTARPLPPPMDNLEILYHDEISETTTESLHNKVSSQYKAWEWLLHHPNITTLEEWRKKQLFAMGTFFYSFEGPNWPDQLRKRWMNYATNECSWVLNDFEIMFAAQQSIALLGEDAYSYQEYLPCNEDGELQHLAFINIKLPTPKTTTTTNLTRQPQPDRPSMPPEIEFLTSLKLFGIALSQINAELSDFLVPEFINLPSLEAVNFYGGLVTSSIPQEMFLMTNLRHLLIGGNKFSTTTIPTEFVRMSSLEYFNLHRVEGIGGKLPSQLGLMTTLTSLDISWSPFTGTIPTELGSLTNMKKLVLDRNQLGGPIPSQLGLLAANTWLALYENSLTGAIPTELGLMTDTSLLRIWNNALTGPLPSQLGLMANITELRLGNDLKIEEGYHNDFSGSIPSELWVFSHLQWLFLPHLPKLHGKVPSDIMMPNLTKMILSGTPHLSGSIPKSVCSVEELDFDCSELLCGCHCNCMT